ncbi:cobalamin-dependent protein [Desulfogranum marinum]|uniref:cobalamin B12-binding domain-containing protein n=1 Tax=Desulfogranum marinum TaxID=453220 RepID=UPI0029C66399|nr:cobalamin-dependent protein [Desulfogranum marinum]
MIKDELYQAYLHAILNGDRGACLNIVTNLLENKINIRELYTQLFQKSMYRIGELWEMNKISVAREHLATAITENMLSLSYPHLVSGSQSAKKVVISCTANEYHQIGGKMVADILEFHGWDAHFLGANTPVDELLQCIDEVKPDLIGLSLAIYFNLPALETTLDAVCSHYPNSDILVGGHAFICGGTSALKKYSGTHYLESLAQLEKNI